tara:strand:- start:565 stop:2358 length:1794 start_codon:yes stop_codon:yes gene_type:complete
MASGVEMLGQMSETDALAGPVQGGNMVVKPNEVPVGGAAMLAKAMRGQANKGVGGIYELPSQEPKTPEFMQMAQQNVDIQESRQRNRYPNNFADDEGGILELPRNLRTAPGVPQTSLAYITDEEKAILGLLNPGTPHKGPEDVPSYDSLDYVAAPSKPVKGATQSSYDTGKTIETKFKDQERREQQQDRKGTGEFNTQANIEQAIQDTGARTSIRDIADTSKGNLQSDPKKVKQNIEQQKKINKAEEELNKLNSKEKLTVNEKKKKDSLTKKILEWSKQKIDNLNIFSDSEKEAKDKKRIEELLKEADGDIYKNLSGSKRRELETLKLNNSMAPSIVKVLGNLGRDFMGPNEDQFLDDNYLNILESEILKGYGTDRDSAIKAFASEYDDRIPGQAIGPDGQDFGTYDPESSLRMLLDKKGDIEQGSDLQKRLNPTEYWKNFKGSGTQGDMAELAGVSLQGLGSGPEDRRLAARIVAAREATSGKDNNNQNNRPRFMEETEEEVIDTPTGVVDEEAQTMEYTSPRTGDVATSVPLNRRFQTDPTQDVAQYRTAPRSESDIYKYMTEGTTGEGIGLEPFSEYQKRRRKALGLEPLGLYG